MITDEIDDVAKMLEGLRGMPIDATLSVSRAVGRLRGVRDALTYELLLANEVKVAAIAVLLTGGHKENMAKCLTAATAVVSESQKEAGE